jgi:hypothetical protein
MPAHCPDCGETYDPADLYFMERPTELCKDCEFSNAADLIRFLIETGQTEPQAIRRLSNSKGEAYAELFYTWYDEERQARFDIPTR